MSKIKFVCTEQLVRVIKCKGISINAFKVGLEYDLPYSSGMYPKRIQEWYPINTEIHNNKLRVSINPTEPKYNYYDKELYYLYLAYSINNYSFMTGSSNQDSLLLGGAILILDDNNNPVSFKTIVDGEVIYSLKSINNIIELPIGLENGDIPDVECEVNCLGDQQVTHYNSNIYQMNNYSESIEDPNSFMNIESAKYYIMKNKITDDPLRNFNTMRLTFEGINS